MKKLKICIISKFPPHKGGTSGLNYWFARALGELGHEVHIVTDSVKENENYFNGLSEEDMKGYKCRNVTVHETKGPRIKNFESLTLASLAIKTIQENGIDVIDTKYYVPYGAIGFFAKLVTGKPLVTRHAGSDVAYLLNDPAYITLLEEMLKGSDKIIWAPSPAKQMKDKGVDKKKIASGGEFGMSVKPLSRKKTRRLLKKIGVDAESPVIGCFGKNFRKGMPELFHALSEIKEDFSLILIPESDESGVRSYLSKFGLEEKTTILEYQPPWAMPALYSSLTALIATELDFPVKTHTPLTATEAIYMAKCTVISEETHRKPTFAKLEDGVDTIVVNPRNTKEYAKKLEWIIRNPDEADWIGRNAKNSLKWLNEKKSVKKMIEVYRDAIESAE